MSAESLPGERAFPQGEAFAPTGPWGIWLGRCCYNNPHTFVVV